VNVLETSHEPRDSIHHRTGIDARTTAAGGESMSKQVKATATLIVKMYLDCPKCDQILDIFNDYELSHLNDDGFLWNLLEAPSRETWEGLEIEFECPKCKAQIVCDKLEY
jgi:radical SAM protein with 4Fe4S-binding SPASM domain